ncbi:MAG TPA: alpha-amylase family glycosyl hydrolase, partial [Thermomicrobiales bacterium]|nr:alpha-amylase family glycosyl hydrolase [Thermomicrobiales bacterium]
AYPDPITSKRIEIIKKFDAAVDISLELKEFDLLLGHVVDIYPAARSVVADLRDRVGQRKTNAGKVAIITGLDAIADLRPFRNLGGEQHSDVYSLTVDRVRARFAAWYSMFPRSSGTVEGKSATFKDVEARLPAIAELGFDVLYFTPIHPIGSTNKKGKNNSLRSTPEDPGSPYAIGSAFGGHDAVEPTLGTIDDFDHLVAEAATHNMEIALDVALQGSPDHPWAKEHPDFFTVRPDGSIKFAENPPKKYEDIYPLSFDTAAWQKLWFELERVITFWIDHGVRSFRVDNPHTKPTIFWEWLITRIHRTHPEVIFLSEAFTRPKVMHALAKAGFAQSYTYFTWRTERGEIEDYLRELTSPDVSQYMRGNLFTNTHDINPFHLQTGGRPMFKSRFVLAATMSSLYGIYNGFELCEATPVPGKEEYLNSEKYEYKVWDWDRPGNIKPLITLVNAARNAHPALQEYDNLRFHSADDARVLTYSKVSEDGTDIVLCLVSLEPVQPVDTWIHLDLGALGLTDGVAFGVQELITGNSWTWTGAHHPVQIDPALEPAWILSLTKLS